LVNQPPFRVRVAFFFQPKESLPWWQRVWDRRP
jgi:hypothetical protein